MAKTLTVLGTASDVGKSVVVAALCRYYRNKGVRVAPFKAQNMSNNSWVTSEGGEIGRAQAVQAEACGVEPSVLMNPILLKPSQDNLSQVVILGKAQSQEQAQGYYKRSSELSKIADQALRELKEQYDLVIIEGAGSTAEVNMRQWDFTNIKIATKHRSPVILVSDIDRGGVFAQIKGTFDLLEPEERDLVCGFLINKFRGDKTILDPGLDWIESQTRKKVLGVLPFVRDLKISEEDAVSLEKIRDRKASRSELLVQVVYLPHISNFTDFDALEKESGLSLQYITEAPKNTLPDLLILPGTKSTISDLEFLESSGLSKYVKRCHQAGVPIVGICGGFQMLGDWIYDPEAVESAQKTIKGLGILPGKTIFQSKKTTCQVRGYFKTPECGIEGYEIHMGETQLGRGLPHAFDIMLRQGERVRVQEGICLELTGSMGFESFVLGTYVHGLFDSPAFRAEFLNRVRKAAGHEMKGSDRHFAEKEDVYDAWAEHFCSNVDMPYLDKLILASKNSLNPIKIC